MSRRIEDLQTDIATAVQATIKRLSFEVLITSTLRTFEEQSMLFRQGRKFSAIQTKAEELEFKWHRGDLADVLLGVPAQYGNRIVTNAGPGQSLHNYGLACDCVPMRNGKPVWGNTDTEDIRLWQEYGCAAVLCGLEWAGNWTRFKEFPHIQQIGASWQELIKP